MTSLIATYEDGKLSFEPIEITYRTLTYYYNQTIERVVQSSLVKTATPRNKANQMASPNEAPKAVEAVPTASPTNVTAKPTANNTPRLQLKSRKNLKQSQTNLTNHPNLNQPVEQMLPFPTALLNQSRSSIFRKLH